MKTIIRNISTTILLSPLIVLIYLTFMFGKKRAIKLWGPFMTFLAKQSLNFWVPKLKNSKDFNQFPSRMKANFWLWRPFFDIHITEETNDVFKLYIKNCPFCEVISKVGLSELNPYVCEGDWAMARENKDKWKFDRKHQIGTGDNFCDHTYIRKK